MSATLDAFLERTTAASGVPLIPTDPVALALVATALDAGPPQTRRRPGSSLPPGAHQIDASANQRPPDDRTPTPTVASDPAASGADAHEAA